MPRRVHERLTARWVQNVKTPGRFLDGNGLYLQVSPSRTKSWFFRYMLKGKTVTKNGKPASREMGLGPLEVVSLAEARGKALACRKQLLEGIDPLRARDDAEAEQRRKAAGSKTFKECAELFIDGHRAKWRNEKHVEQWETTLKTYAYPTFGDQPIALIDTPTVLEALKPIWHTKAETASRLRGRIAQILSWAVPHGYREPGLNPAQWKGHLDQVLPRRSQIAPTKNMPSMPYADVPTFIEKLRADEGIAARGLEFLILTAARTNEVIFAPWSEIDLEARRWTIAAKRMKSGREHVVPLSPAAVRLLEALRDKSKGTYIFPTPKKKDGHLSNGAFLALLERMGVGHYTPHGFRSSFSTWANDMSNFDSNTIEQALAHVEKDKVKSAYDRALRFEKRRKLMEAWAGYCNRPKKEASVTQIHMGKRR
jgi:integrase